MAAISELLTLALFARESFLDPEHQTAFRLFNGFLEGCPALCLDIYAHTALLHNYANTPAEDQTDLAQSWIFSNLPWIQSIIIKSRFGQTNDQKRGLLIQGQPDNKIFENGIWYAIDLRMNRDASFYMDTRNLRSWARQKLKAKTVLNTFSYTGSLGVAALAGGAKRVVQLDRNPTFLNFSKQSYALNQLTFIPKDLLGQDFYPAVAHLKKTGQTFDCVFLDPPFFATTPSGRVDLETGSTRLINKLRPLVKDGGWLVAINNALFVSGQDYLASIQALCKDGYLEIEELIPVPADFTGYTQTIVSEPPVKPEPFNHSTKIAILRVHRKQSPTLST